MTLDDSTRILLMVIGLIILLAGAACYAFLIRKKRLRSSNKFILGVIIGFIIFEGAGILLTEFFGYPDAAGIGFIWGFAAGAWIGLFLSLRYPA